MTWLFFLFSFNTTRMISTGSTIKNSPAIWKALASDAGLKKEIDNKLLEIAPYLLENLDGNQPGLLNGNGGQCLFFAYLNAYQQTDKYNDAIGQLLENSFTAINDRELNATSFCTGISGVLWTIWFLNKEGFADLDDYFEDIMPVLQTALENDSKISNFDFLHGATGLAFYLSHLSQHTKPLLETYLKNLGEKAEEDETTFKWLGQIKSGDSMKDVYNLSLSHGITSIVIVLCALQELFPEQNDISRRIKKAVHFIRLQKEIPATADDSLFPNYASTEKQENSRLSWCYGDLGIAFALLKAGQTLNDQSMVDEAVEIMLHNAQRRDLQKAFVADTGICHGTAGIAHMFNRFYHYAPRDEFKDAAMYWLKQTLAMASFTDGVAGFKTFDGPSGWKNDSSLLDGVAGIGLALLGFVCDAEPKWDRCLLLS